MPEGDEYNRHVLSELAKAGRLKIIARFGVGFDKVDLEAASEFGIAVTNMAGTMSMPVAELTMTLILSTARSIASVTESCGRRMVYRTRERQPRWKNGRVGRVRSHCEETGGISLGVSLPYPGV